MFKMFNEIKKYIILMAIALSIFTEIAYAGIVRDVEDLNNTDDTVDQKDEMNMQGKAGPIAFAGGIVNAITNLILPHSEGNNAETTSNPQSGTSGGDSDKETADRESCSP